MEVPDTTIHAPAPSGTRIAELVFLDRLAPPLRTGVLGVAVVAAFVVAAAIEAIHHHLATTPAPAGLNPVASLIASGSSAATVWPGWLAAVFFGGAVLRLRHGPAEPPPGRGDSAAMSVAQLRAAVRNEYRGVRIALAGVGLLALIDTARALITVVTAHGDGTPAGTILATIFEALGLVMAALVLAAWAWSFREEIDRWGAL